MARCTRCGARIGLVERYLQGDRERFILRCPQCRHAFVTDVFGQELGSLAAMVTVQMMDLDALRAGFTYLLLERVDLSCNVARFYYIAWQPTLLDTGAVVRIYGRKDGHRRVMDPQPYPSLDEAWPAIRAILRRRLRNGYHIVETEEVTHVLGAPPVQTLVVDVEEMKQMGLFSASSATG